MNRRFSSAISIVISAANLRLHPSSNLFAIKVKFCQKPWRACRQTLSPPKRPGQQRSRRISQRRSSPTAREKFGWMGWPIATITGDKTGYRPWLSAFAAAGSSSENVPNTAERSTAQDKAPARKAFFIPPAAGVGHSPKSDPTTLSSTELPINKMCAKDGGLPPFYVWLNDSKAGNLLEYVAKEFRSLQERFACLLASKFQRQRRRLFI